MFEARFQEDPPTPMVGKLVDLIIAMISVSFLSICLYVKAEAVTEWSKLHVTAWLVFSTYIFSLLFVTFSTAIIQVWGLNLNPSSCHYAIVLCFLFYFSTKVTLILSTLQKYQPLIESCRKPHLRSKLYCFNTFGVLSVYGVLGVFDIVNKFDKIDDNGVCYVVVNRVIVTLILSYDAVVNIYLTALFISPIRRRMDWRIGSYSFHHGVNTHTRARLRQVAVHSLIGSCAMLIGSIVNLTVLLCLNGEPAWACSMGCNSDILFSAAAMQWITSRDDSKDIDHFEEDGQVMPPATEEIFVTSWQMDPMADNLPSYSNVETEGPLANRTKLTAQ
ncbi:hypothetical protein BKA56DRAFT_476611 [Ilyonectria sp. MPI-CAGE-AT-0026]|nr:hypothetical protein BKA56DRAFT_476611 [Ilyonectria sp. MPI-CAGE-AT-0026]